MKILCGEDVYVHKNLVFSIENIQKKVDEHQYFLLNLESPLIDKIEVKPSLKGGSNLSMKLNPLEPIIIRKFNYQNFLSFRNQLTCEFHRELLINLNLYNRKQTTLQI